MKFISMRIGVLFLFLAFAIPGSSQYIWKLSKDKDGIKVFTSETPTSKFKLIKVECTLEGSYDKLISIITNVDHHKDWVYNVKNSHIIRKINPYDLYYYTETVMPWPMSNRDAVVHLKIVKDSLQRFLKISSVGEPKYIAEKSGKVRVPRSLVNWYVTMPSSKTIRIVYTFDADPGGSIPSWLANMFVDKGPFESFKKLSELLKR